MQINHKKKLKIGLFFTNTNRDYNKSAASTWIRIWQMIDIYKQLGARVFVNNPLIRYDVAIVFRKPKRKYYNIIRFLKLISKKVYFDTCINIFEINQEIGEERLKYALKIGGKVDGIICASKRIAQLSENYTKSVYVFEDPVNIEHFCKFKSEINFDSPKFGWSGVGKKAQFLNKYKSIINDNIVLISEEGIFESNIQFKYDYVRWRYETFPDDLLCCDIALLPRDIDSNYNQGHSAFKALVFAVSGIPIIANKVPSYVDLSNYYESIVFLEDFNEDVYKCIEELRYRSRDTQKLKDHYSRENQANMLLNYFSNHI